MSTMKKTNLIVVIILVTSMFLVSCSGGKDISAIKGGADISKYPVQTTEELTYWCALPTVLSSVTDNLGNTPFSKEYEKRTGIKVHYTHPAIGQESEALNLMVASNELADMVSFSWSWYNGGVQRAIDDNIIYPINDIMAQYAPNLTEFLKENPEYDKMVKTDDNKYPIFPLILDGDKLTTTTGPAIRKDLLDKYGLQTPETIEDWTNVLRTLKKNGIQIPMSFSYGNIINLYSMFSATSLFFIDVDGKIKYGPAEPSYKEALAGINKWYEEGLLDNNIVSVDTKMIDSYILNGQTAATITSGGSGIGKYMDAAKIPGFNLEGVMYPVKERGTASKYTNIVLKHLGAGVAITTKCKNAPLAAKFLDYVYSEEGHMFANFGMDGISYNMIDGEPVYSDLIMHNPNGEPVSQIMAQYTQANNGRALIQDERYILQYYSKPQQQIALREWSKGAELARTSFQLPYLNYTLEESEQYSTILNELLSYVNGISIKFFTGVEPFENYDAYLARLDKLGLKKILEIQEAAYARYKLR